MPADAPTAVTPGPWSVAASRHVVRDRWISVRADDCVTALGVSVAPFYVLEYPDWVQIVAIDTDDRLVLVRQYRHGAARIMLELPCGGVELADRDPVAAARRELAEETGYGSGEWRLVGTLWPNPANQTNRSRIVLATGVRPMTTPVADAGEELEVIQVPVPEAVALALAGELPQAMHVAALATALTPLGRWTPLSANRA